MTDAPVHPARTVSPGFVIREATAGDVAAITAIYEEAVRNGTASFEIEPPTADEMAGRFARLAEAGFPYLVADTGSGIAGYAYAGPYRPRPAYRWSVENSVYVAPSAQGMGVGRALLAALIAESARRGFRQMIAVIGDSANAASIGLHSALGFRMVGTFESVGNKHGRWLDTVLMQLPLGEGADSAP
ncbi:GNAT family N-acetyltransferase [Bosea sp. 117]|uniref:GNAT family N-acetyltransferase n=1 Tax=Bosea sp. 117 TaxID=1125973 RepID=UPI00068EB2FC|nr:GNAT family N-acetyltransferase [Bosea sp. 117]